MINQTFVKNRKTSELTDVLKEKETIGILITKV